MKLTIHSRSASDTISIGRSVGAALRGGEVIECISDLGGGKTTFVHGLAKGFGSSDPASSPSFTISNTYQRPDGKALYHFDFYRLNDPGIVANELAEVEGDSENVVVVEWGDVVHTVLPESRILITIKSTSDAERSITFSIPDQYEYIKDALKNGATDGS